MADPANYRTKQEVEDERKNDPIPKLRKDYALKQGLRPGGGVRGHRRRGARAGATRR